MEGAVAFGEVLAVGEGGLVGDEDGGETEGTLAEGLTAGDGLAAAEGHEQVVFACEDVDDASVDIAAVVVADVDDDALAGLVFCVEIEVELVEVVVAHGGYVDVAELAAGDAIDVGATVFDPGAVEEATLDGERHGAEDGVVLFGEVRLLADGVDGCDRDDGAFADESGEEIVEVGGGFDGGAVDGEYAVTGVDGASFGFRDGGGAEGDDFADDEAVACLEWFALEAETETAYADGRGRDGAGAGVGGVELADEEVLVAAEFDGGAGTVDVGLPLVAKSGPVVAVEVSVEEAAVECVPELVEDDLLFLIEVDVHAGGDADGFGGVRLEREGVHDAAGVTAACGWPGRGLKVVELFGVRGEAVGGLAAGGGGELASYGWLAGEFVEGVGVEVGLVGGGGEEDEGFAVGADDGGFGVETERKQGDTVADALKDDLYRFGLLVLGSG